MFPLRPQNSLFLLHVNNRSIYKSLNSLLEMLQNFPNDLPDNLLIRNLDKKMLTKILHCPMTNLSILLAVKELVELQYIYLYKLNFEVTEEFQIKCEDSKNIWIKLQYKLKIIKNM